MRCVFMCLLLAFVSSGIAAAEPVLSAHAQKTLDIFRTIVEVDTSKAM